MNPRNQETTIFTFITINFCGALMFFFSRENMYKRRPKVLFLGLCVCVCGKTSFRKKTQQRKFFFALYTSFQFSDELFIFSAKWRKVFLLVVCGLQSFLYTSTCVEVHTDLNGIWVAASFVCLTTAAITY